MKLTLMVFGVFGAVLLTAGCKSEADPSGARAKPLNESSNFAGRDERDAGDPVKETAPGASAAPGTAVPGVQPTLNPEAQDPKGRGPKDPRMEPGTPASERELAPTKP